MTAISQQTISARAYQLWEHAGCSGEAEDHWRRAERELRVAADPASLLLSRFSARSKAKPKPMKCQAGDGAAAMAGQLVVPQPRLGAEIMIYPAPVGPSLHEIIAQTARNLEMAAACTIVFAQGWQDLFQAWWGMAAPWLRTGVEDLYALTSTSQEWAFAQGGLLPGGLHSPGWIAAPPPAQHEERSSPVVVLFPSEWRRQNVG